MKKLTLTLGRLTSHNFYGVDSWIGVKSIHSFEEVSFTVQREGGDVVLEYKSSPSWMAKVCGVDELEIIFKAEVAK